MNFQTLVAFQPCQNGTYSRMLDLLDYFDVFNLGSEDKLNVREIADLVVKGLGLENVEYKFTGGYQGRGWKGDVKFMQLSIERIKKIGWKPKYNSEESVRKTIEDVKNLI